MTASHDPHAWVLAAPFRAHVRSLIASSGLPWRVVAVAAGVQPTVVRSLLGAGDRPPRPRLRRVDAARLLHLTRPTLDAAAISYVGARSSAYVTESLLRRGWSPSSIAVAADIAAPEAEALAEGARWCTRLTHWRLVALGHAVGLDPGLGEETWDTPIVAA